MRNRLGRTDEGFTLVELMVVVLIIAILIAVAVPTFLGARRGAQDRAAQVQLRNLVLVERNHYVETRVYSDVAADLENLEPVVQVHPTDPTAGVVIVLSADPTIVCGTRTSESGNNFSIWESVTAGTYYGTSDLSGACPVATPAGFVATGW